MRKTLTLTVVVVGLIAPSRVARADPIIVLPAGSVWNYTFSDPTADSVWNTTAGVGGIWKSGAAPFGNCPDAGCEGFPTDFNARTSWPADDDNADDLWVRTAITIPTAQLPSNLRWNLGVDNGFTLFVNGFQIAADNAEGYTYRWEYSGNIPRAVLRPGPQVVALALEDHGSLTAFDMEIAAAPVPEPATLLLVGTGAAAIGRSAWKRRKKGSDESGVRS
jgi:hypothetical protein